jgi:hypothetical protein
LFPAQLLNNQKLNDFCRERREKEKKREERKLFDPIIYEVFFFCYIEATQKVYLVWLVDASKGGLSPIRVTSIPTAREHVLLARLGVCIQS